ncbi:MAG: alpha-amylase, partial [Bacteroidales bacterium]|nr:alpha-amylase [Bacteroidales bacterium]
MKRIFTLLTLSICALTAMAQGWPSKYQGVMLQGFYWDSFSDTQWTNLESQADELAEFFQLIWI